MSVTQSKLEAFLRGEVESMTQSMKYSSSGYRVQRHHFESHKSLTHVQAILDNLESQLNREYSGFNIELVAYKPKEHSVVSWKGELMITITLCDADEEEIGILDTSPF